MGFWSFLIIFCFISFYVYWYSSTKALKFNANIKNGSKLPSLPSYYGTYSFFWLILPIFLILVTWFFFKPFFLDFLLIKKVPSDFLSTFEGNPDMLVDTIKATNPEKIFPGTNPLIIDSAVYYQTLTTSSDSYVFLLVLVVGLISSLVSLRKVSTFSIIVTTSQG